MNLYEILLAKSLAGNSGGGGGGEIVLPTDTMLWFVNDVKVDTIDDVSTDYIAFTDPDGNACSLEFHEDIETGELVLQLVQYEGDTPVVDNEPKITICYYSNDSTKKNLAFNAISEYANWYTSNN